jgi:hypothetical protein
MKRMLDRIAWMGVSVAAAFLDLGSAGADGTGDGC